jgi:dethiobiotin synthetase
MNDPTVSRETRARRIAVVGTGTEVGKTHVTVALVAALAARGAHVSGLKPIESGIATAALTDAERLASVSTVFSEPAPYRFGEPVSPHLAARRLGVELSLEAAAGWVRRQPARITLVETAGALLSPLGPGLTNLDLVRTLAPDAMVLVGLDRLGILHEIAACLVVLRTLAPELPAPQVVLNAPPVPDASTSTNAEELDTLGIVQGVMVMPRMAPTSAPSLAMADRIVTQMGL